MAPKVTGFIWAAVKLLGSYILVVTVFHEQSMSPWYKGLLIIGAIGWLIPMKEEKWY